MTDELNHDELPGMWSHSDFMGGIEIPELPQITQNEHSFRVTNGTIVITTRFIPDLPKANR